MIKSRWRVTYKGFTLLDHGDWMPESPTMPLTGSVQESSFVGAKWGKSTGRGNRVRSFNWTRVLEFDSVRERMGYQMLLGEGYPVGETDELIVEVEDGSTHGVASFSISSFNAAEITNEPTHLSLSFEGIGGKGRIIDRAGLGGLGWEYVGILWEGITTKWEEKISV